MLIGIAHSFAGVVGSSANTMWSLLSIDGAVADGQRTGNRGPKQLIARRGLRLNADAASQLIVSHTAFRSMIL